MSSQRPIRKKNAGFTLSEVMIAMVLISMMCLGVFAGLKQVSQLALGVAIRSEAYHLMQQEAERLLAADFGAFVGSEDQKIKSALKTTYAWTTSTAVDLPINTPAVRTQFGVGRWEFTRRVVQVESTPVSKTLRVEVQWFASGRSYMISTPLFRVQR